jgi:glycosyltransferase involved in cell wall biosynthesis
MISVITPCRNVISDSREPFFRRMIETLYAQTYQDFEHIVIDGASTDGTVDLLQKYHQEGHINILISEPDRNVNDAMNKGIRLAQGDIIHVMNSDNYFTDPQFFETSLQALQNFGVDFTHADRSIETREGKFVGIKRGDERSAFFRMPFRYQTMLIKRNVYDEVGPFDDKYDIAADYKFMMNMLLAGKRGYYIPKVYICSLDGGITSDRDKVVREVTQVLYEGYGQRYGLTECDCQDIYLRRMSPNLFSKINANVPDERIKKSLRYCYELSLRANKEGTRGSRKESA